MDNTAIPVIPKISDPSMITGYNHVPIKNNNEYISRERKIHEQNKKPEYKNSDIPLTEEIPSLQTEKSFLGINKKVFVILVVVLLVLIIAAIIYYYFFYKKDEQNPAMNNQSGTPGVHQRPQQPLIKRTAHIPPPNQKIVPPPADPVNHHEENLAVTSVDELDKIIKNESRPQITSEMKDGVKVFSSKINNKNEEVKANDNSTINKMKNESDEFINDDIRKVMNNEMNFAAAETSDDNEFDKLMNERMRAIAADVEEEDDSSSKIDLKEDLSALEEDNNAKTYVTANEENIVVCGAINKTTGKACNRKPTQNSDRCQWHKKRDKN